MKTKHEEEYKTDMELDTLSALEKDEVPQKITIELSSRKVKDTVID